MLSIAVAVFNKASIPSPRWLGQGPAAVTGWPTSDWSQHCDPAPDPERPCQRHWQRHRLTMPDHVPPSYRSIYLSRNLSISIYLSVYLSIYLTIYLSIYASTYWSIDLLFSCDENCSMLFMPKARVHEKEVDGTAAKAETRTELGERSMFLDLESLWVWIQPGKGWWRWWRWWRLKQSPDQWHEGQWWALLDVSSDIHPITSYDILWPIFILYDMILYDSVFHVLEIPRSCDLLDELPDCSGMPGFCVSKHCPVGWDILES